MYDIIFISYEEPNADQNFKKLCEKYPYALRVHGIKGIHNAHIAAAKLACTKFFWVVDADAEIVDSFNFSYKVPEWDNECVHVWRSINPVNGLSYGYGGVKLLPRKLTLTLDNTTSDMTTSISSKFKCIDEVSNITRFNVDPFSTWRSAFRECVKLSSKIIDRQNDDETNERLHTWCTVGIDQPFGNYAVQGALAGKEYGETNKGNVEALRKINDFEWILSKYNEQ